MSLKTDISKEFARKTRSILDMDRWKAVEFRQFLLYTGPVVLKGVLTESRYEHFMQLSIALRILLSDEHCLSKNVCAKELICSFISKLPELYDATFLKYNFHCLSHLADECIFYQSNLHSFSAFKYESFLCNVKKGFLREHKLLRRYIIAS